MTAVRWLWANKGVISIGALIVGLCILFGFKEVQLGKARLDLATCQAANVKLVAEIDVQNIAVAKLGADTIAQRAEVARLLKLVQPKAKVLNDAADAAKARIPAIDAPVEASTKVPMASGCNQALFDAAGDMK